MGNRLGIASSLLAVAALVGCGGGSKSTKTGGDTQGLGDSSSAEIKVPRVDASLCDTKGKKISTFDLDQNGKPDVWKLFKTVDEGGTMIEVMTCKQVDLDHDGRKDYVITFNSKGGKLTEEFDFDFDGRFDARHFFDEKTGAVYLIERDSDYDKKPDIWEKYDKEGLIESVRRDRNADGKPDVWEQYEKGTLMAILWDDDFDARVDRKDEVKKPQAPAKTTSPDEEEGADDEGATDGGDESASDGTGDDDGAGDDGAGG